VKGVDNDQRKLLLVNKFDLTRLPSDMFIVNSERLLLHGRGNFLGNDELELQMCLSVIK
jgi:hypothetical protein